MKPSRVLAVAVLMMLAACAPKGPEGVDPDILAQAVGQSVGDPGTCVVLAERETGNIVWKSAKSYVCARTLPSCVTSAERSVEDLAKEAAKGGVLMTGCSNVTWAAGPTRRENLVFAAVLSRELGLPWT